MNAARRFLLAATLGTVLAGCASSPEQADDDGYVESKTAEKADRQKDRVEGKVDERVDQETDEAVDGVLDKVLNKVFK